MQFGEGLSSLMKPFILFVLFNNLKGHVCNICRENYVFHMTSRHQYNFYSRVGPIRATYFITVAVVRQLQLMLLINWHRYTVHNYHFDYGILVEPPHVMEFRGLFHFSPKYIIICMLTPLWPLGFLQTLTFTLTIDFTEPVCRDS